VLGYKGFDYEEEKRQRPDFPRFSDLMSGNASDRESPYQIWEICLNRESLTRQALRIYDCKFPGLRTTGLCDVGNYV